MKSVKKSPRTFLANELRRLFCSAMALMLFASACPGPALAQVSTGTTQVSTPSQATTTTTKTSTTPAASSTSTSAAATTQLATNGENAIKLPNGMRVLMIEEHAFPVVSCQLWYHVGSLNDPVGASGTCHVVEHLLTESMKANDGNLARQLVSNGGKYDAFTSDDFTVFVENLPSSQLELALTLQAQRMKARDFSKAEVDQAIHQVQQEIDGSAKNYDRLLMKEVRTLVYTRHPYKNMPSGISEELKSLTPAVVGTFHNDNFTPQNATLVIAGDIKPADTLQQVQKLLGTLPPNAVAAPSLMPIEPDQLGERRVYLKYGGKKNKLVVAFRAPNANETNTAAANILENLLGNSSSGLLKQAVIDAKVGDGASAAFELRRQPGLISISVEGPSTANSGKMLSTVEELCDKLKDGGFDETELSDAKKRAVFSFQKQKMGPYKMAFQLGFFDSLGKLEQAKNWTRQLEAVTKQDIMRLAALYMVQSKRSIGFLVAQSSPAPAQKTANLDPNGRSTHGVAPTMNDQHDTCVARHFRPERISRSEFGNIQIAAYDESNIIAQATDESPYSSEGSSKTESKPSETPASNGSTSPSTTTETAADSKPTSEPDTTAATIKSAAVTNANIKQCTLGNGIRVVVFQVKSSPVVRISGSVRAGEIYDPTNKPGLSDVMVAIMNGGSAKIAKENSVRMQNQIGLEKSDQIRFFEGRDQITFYTSCMAQDMGTQLKLISHHLTEPLVDEANLSAARNSVAATIKRKQNTTQDRAKRLLLQNLLSDNSPFNPPDPHDSWNSVLKVTADDVNAFRSNNIAPATSTIVIAGNVEPDNAQRLVASVFNNWVGKAKGPVVNPQPNKRQIQKVTLPIEDSPKLDITLGRLLSTPPTKLNYARLLLADCALTKHPLYARLTNPIKLKAELDPSIELSSSIIPMAQHSAWILSLQSPEPKVRGITGAIKQQFKELCTTGLGAQELIEMKRYVSGQTSVSKLSDVASCADSIVDAFSANRDADYWFNLPARVDEAALADVNQFIKDDFQPDHACVVIAGSKKAVKQVPSFRRGKD